MTLQQGLIFGLLAAMMVLFVWDRLRFDLVALLGLVAAMLLGVVRPAEAFRGFSDDVVIIVASALVVSAGVGKSDLLRRAIRRLEARLRTPGAQVTALAGSVTVLSAFMKNIGALAIFLPVAIQVARRSGTPVSALLMPMSFGSLVGGIVTLVGTSPNILVSRARAEATGQPFAMFDFAPVGLAVAAASMAFLAFGWRLLGAAGRRAAVADAAAPYLTEARVPAGSPFAGRTVADLTAAARGVAIVAVQHDEWEVEARPGDALAAGDILVLRGEPAALRETVAAAGLELLSVDARRGRASPDEAAPITEAVVMPESPLAGRSTRALALRDQHGVRLLAVARRGGAAEGRMTDLRLRAGDVLALQGPAAAMPAVLVEIGCLALRDGGPEDGPRAAGWVPLAILGVAMAVVAAGWVPVPAGFFAAAVAMVLSGTLSLREAYDALDLPILVLLACLIPISDAVGASGGAALIAGGLAAVAGHLPPAGTVGLVVLAAMAVTPFLNNAATALIMAPIAAELAQRVGMNLDPLLMAVAIGCACDFLTPIGHQCNTLVMGPGGYRFGDYARLGAPLTLIVLISATVMIPLVWPLR